jgi:hypothetical protein|tara:strand:- start:16693 stop:16812 length:120 start_codon:yes stop_codon:yes gene_type:complete
MNPSRVKGLAAESEQMTYRENLYSIRNRIDEKREPLLTV